MTTASPKSHALSLRTTARAMARRLGSGVVVHPVWAVFLLALAIRVAVSVVIAVVHPHSLSVDAIGYSHLAADQATGRTAQWSFYFHWLYEHTATLLVPVTGLYELFGVHQLLGQLYVALLGAGTAAIVTRLALELMPKGWAIAVGLIVALLPTQVIWSSLILKDAPVWFLLAGLALTIALAGKADGRRLLALAVIAGALLVLLGYLRVQTLVIASWALMLAVALGPRRGRVRRTAGAIALAVLIPWLVFDLQPAGVRVLHLQPPPAVQRCKNAAGAGSAITGAPLPLSSSSACSGAVPARENGVSGVTSNAGYLPHGVLIMLAQPYPWARGSVSLHLAGADELIWYPLVLLALVGLLSLRARHLRVMAFPVIAGGTILISYALTEGNVGTAFRHRGEFEWVVALLAVLGLRQLIEWRARHSHPMPATAL